MNPDSALRGEAKLRGWEIRDFRTGHKAARIGVPTAIGAGALGGGVAAGMALWRLRRRQAEAAEQAALAAAARRHRLRVPVRLVRR